MRTLSDLLEASQSGKKKKRSTKKKQGVISKYLGKAREFGGKHKGKIGIAAGGAAAGLGALMLARRLRNREEQ